MHSDWKRWTLLLPPAIISSAYCADFLTAPQAQKLLFPEADKFTEKSITLSDEQLDRCAPVSLNAGAPLTTQYIIEDHALRHSWHHLAKIKAALKSIRPTLRGPMLVSAL